MLEEGPAIAPDTARRLACDASLLDLGRKTRKISWPLRRALKTRDQGCRFPGCENRRHLDAHHIEHWADGGTTKLDNLVLLCRRHHRALHEGGFIIDGENRFFDRHGRRIEAVPASPPGLVEELHVMNRDLDVGATTIASGRGDRMDLSLTVDAVIEYVEGPQRFWPHGGRRFRGAPTDEPAELDAEKLAWELLGELVHANHLMLWEPLALIRGMFPRARNEDVDATARETIRKLLAKNRIYGYDVTQRPLRPDELDTLIEGGMYPFVDEIWLAPTEAGIAACATA